MDKERRFDFGVRGLRIGDSRIKIKDGIKEAKKDNFFLLYNLYIL